MLKRVFAFLALLLLAAAPAMADMLAVGIVAQGNSPIIIQRCLSGLTNSEVGNTNYYIDFAGTFKNRTDKAIKAFRLRFDVFNDFNEHVDTLYGTEQDGVAPYATDDNVKSTASIDPSSSYGSADEYLSAWQFINTHETASYVVCSVDTVRFTDGPMWRASVTPAAIKKTLAHAKRAPGHFWVKSDE